MDAFFNVSVILSLSSLTSVVVRRPSVCNLVSSNSVVQLLILTSLTSIFTAKDHRLRHASVVTQVLTTFVTILCKILTLVSPVLVPTLLSNFTFAAVVVAVIAMVISIIGLFIARIIQGVMCVSTGFMIGLYMIRQEKLSVKQGERELTERELKDKLDSKFEKLASDYKPLIKVCEEVSTVHIPLAVTTSTIRYVMLSYYSVMLPPLLNADQSSKILPMDIVVYGFMIALGVHAAHEVIWNVCAAKVQSVVVFGTRFSVMYVVRVLGEVFWCLVTSGLIAIPFAEKVLFEGSASLLWAFVKVVLVDGIHRLCMSLSVTRDDDIPEWVKTACAVGVGWMWLRYGMMLCEAISDVGLKFSVRYAMM